MLIAGVDKTIETANKLMGDTEDGYGCYADENLKEKAPCYASAAIGDGAYLQLDEHVHGFASISRNGLVLPMTYILKIEDAAGKPLQEWKLEEGEQVVRPDAAYITADMMSDPNASYISRKPHRYNNGQGTWKFSMKTGTTNDAKDGLLLGFSTQYSAGVWVGSHNRQVEMRGFMETMTQPIWEGWMREAHKDLKPEERPKPEGVQTLPAFIVRTHVGVASVEPSPTNDLFPSWYKKKGATRGEKRVIDIVSNKLATDCTPERAKKEVDDAAANQFSTDRFVGGGGNTANTSEQDDIHKCDDIKPGISASYSGGKLFIDVTAGTHPLSSEQFPGTVNVIVDGQVLRSFTVSNSGVVSMDYAPSSSTLVRAEVIDSVLYDASTQITVPGTGGGGGGGGSGNSSGTPTITRAQRVGNRVYFEWSGGNGNVSIINSANVTLCSATNGECDVSFGIAQPGTQVRARDSDGDTSAPRTID